MSSRPDATSAIVSTYQPLYLNSHDILNGDGLIRMRYSTLYQLTIFLLVSGVVFGNTPRQHSLNFYLLTEHTNERVWSLYRVDVNRNTSSQIFDFDYRTTSRAIDVLSSNERSAIQQGIDEGILPADWMTARLVNKQVDRLWQFDADTLIVQITTQFCEPIGRAVCFGQVEFARFDLSRGILEPSFFVLDFHDSRLNRDPHFNSISNVVMIGEVSFNPTHALMTVNINGGTLYDSKDGWVTILIDFSTSAVSHRDFNAVESSAWSPDSKQLAIMQRENCVSQLCDMYLSIYSLATTKLTTLRTTNGFPLSTTAAILWKDNATLIYKSFKLSLDGYEPFFVQYTINGGIEAHYAADDPSTNQWMAIPGLLVAYSTRTQHVHILNWNSYIQSANYPHISLVFGASRSPFSVAMLQNQDYVAIYSDAGVFRECRVDLSQFVRASEIMIYATSPE